MTKYDDNWINQIDPKSGVIPAEVLEFTYQNGVSYLKDIHNGMKAISDRSLILLSYLALAIGFTFTHIVSKNTFSYSSIIGILFIVYYTYLAYDIVNYAKPRKTYSPYKEPKELLRNELITSGYHSIQLVRCMELQSNIHENKELMEQMLNKFERALSYALIIPLLVKLYFNITMKIKSYCC